MSLEALQRVHEEIQNLTKSMREVLERKDAERAEFKEQIDRINERLDKLEEKQARVTSTLPADTGEERRFSWARALYGIAFGHWQEAKAELEAFVRAHEQYMAATKGQVLRNGYVFAEVKALTAGTNTQGGYLVPPEQAREIIDLLRSRLVFERLPGIRTYQPTSAPFQIPTLAGSATAYQVGESTNITASQPSFGQVTMSPKTSAAMVPISNRLIQLSDPAVEDIVRRDLTEVLARQVDTQRLLGSGTGNNLLGIVNTPGIGTYQLAGDAGNGATPTGDDLIKAEGVVEDAGGENLAWVFHPRTKRTIRTLKDSQGRYLWEPGLGATDPPTILGKPYVTSTLIPTNVTKGTSTDTSYILLGDWRYVAIAVWVGLTIEASREASYWDGAALQSAFARNETVVRALIDHDVAVLRPSAICVVSGVRP